MHTGRTDGMGIERSIFKLGAEQNNVHTYLDDGLVQDGVQWWVQRLMNVLEENR